VPEPVAAVGQALGTDPMSYVLTGGEDHALVATFDMGDVPKQWVVIGKVAQLGTVPSGAVLVDGHGWAGAVGGWQHF